MVKSLIDSDIKLMRARYDEALQLQGIAVKYQWPNMPGTNNQAESLIDSYSSIHDTHIFFEGNPKAKTFKRYGWVIENDKDLPFIIHCSFNLPHLQKDSIFRIICRYARKGIPCKRIDLRPPSPRPHHLSSTSSI